MNEARALQEHLAAWKKKNIGVMSLSAYAKSLQDCEKFRENVGVKLDFPVYFTPWAAEQLKVESVPTLLILKPDGTVAARFSGADDHGGDLMAAVEKKLATLP